MGKQSYTGRFWLTESEIVVTKGANVATVTIPEGHYRIHGYTGESDRQLIEEIENQIQTASGFSVADTVTYSTTTGYITFTFDAATTISWTTANIKIILGLDGVDTSVAGTSFTGTDPKYIWRPGYQPKTFPTNLDRFWQVGSTTVSGRSRDGTAWVTVGNKFYESLIEYGVLSENEVLKNDDEDNFNCFEQLFEDVFHEGEPVYIYPDRSDLSNYVIGLFFNDGSIQSFNEYATRHVDSFQGLWDVQARFIKYDPITLTAADTSAASGDAAMIGSICWFDTTLMTAAGESVDTTKWHPCDGTAITTGPLAGQTAPDINGQGYFIRGSATSGTTQTSQNLAHTHTIEDHDHHLGGHSHTVNAHYHGTSAHTHSLTDHYHVNPNHSHSISNHTHDMGNHTHTITDHVHEHDHEHYISEHYHGWNSHNHVTDLRYINKWLFNSDPDGDSTAYDIYSSSGSSTSLTSDATTSNSTGGLVNTSGTPLSGTSRPTTDGFVTSGDDYTNTAIDSDKVSTATSGTPSTNTTSSSGPGSTATDGQTNTTLSVLSGGSGSLTSTGSGGGANTGLASPGTSSESGPTGQSRRISDGSTLDETDSDGAAEARPINISMKAYIRIAA